MSAWTLRTWFSIVLLVAGSLAVFVWFVRDAGRIFQRLGRAERNGKGAQKSQRD